MADFTANLPGPPQISGAGFSGSQSDLGVLGGALSGIANLGDKILGHLRENEATDTSNAVADKLTKLVQTNFGQNPDGTRFIGDQPTDPNAAAAASSPIVQGVNRQLDNLHQANQQGALSPAELMTRGSVIVQDAINANPLYATEIRQAAQAVLGTQPTIELTHLAEQTAAEADAGQRQVKLDLVTSAAHSGITFMNPDGTLDFDKMASAGATVNFQNKQMEDTIRAAQLAASQAGPKPTNDELIASSVNPFIKAANPVFEQVQAGLLDSVPGLVQKLQNQGKPQQAAAVLAAIGTQQATFMGYIHTMVVRNNIPPQAAAQLETYYNSFFDNYKQLASGDLSTFATNALALKDMDSRGGIAFRESAPALAALHYAGGDQAVAAGLNVAVADPGTRAILDKQTLGLINGATGPLPGAPVTPVGVMHNTASALTGGYNVAAEQDPNMQRKVLGGLITAFTAYTTKPDKLNPTELNAFGHSASQIANLGLQSNDPRNLTDAANVVNTPAALRAFDLYSKDQGHANQAPIVAQGLIALNTKAVVRGLPMLGQGARTTLPIPVASSGNAFLDAMAAGSGQGAGAEYASMGLSPVISVNAGSAFNPLTGRIEMTVTATGPDNKAYTLTPAQMQAALNDSGVQTYRGQVGSMNRSLDAVVHLKDAAPGREKDFKPLELKQLLVSGSGFPLKAGMQPIPMPSWLTQPGGGAAAPSGNGGNGPSPNFAARVIGHESGGANVPNALGSSAAGPGQFLPKTWLSVARSLPDTKDMTDAQIMALRTANGSQAAEFQSRVVEAYGMQNTAALNAKGIQHVDDTALELAHWFGPDGAAKLLKSPMTTRAEDLFSPEILRLNPSIKGKDARQIYNMIAAKFGGTQQ